MDSDQDSYMGVIAGGLVLLFSIERILNTFNQKSKNKISYSYDQLFTASMLFLYAIHVIFGVGYFIHFQPSLSISTLLAGAILVVSGSVIRRGAISAMNDDWCVFISPTSIRSVCAIGPFALSRHPYYWASMMELNGLGLLLGCYIVNVMSFLVYLPLLILRCFLEEKELLKKFGDEYQRYQEKTPFFVIFKNMKRV